MADLVYTLPFALLLYVSAEAPTMTLLRSLFKKDLTVRRKVDQSQIQL